MIVKAPDILLPKDKYDYTKWAVVACDQFTSQPEYWDKLDKECGSVSALRIVFPEVYLKDGEAKRIASINANMKDYLNKGIFDEYKGAYILVERKTSYGHKRIGLILSVDVEKYDYTPLTKLPIKATERTVTERIPVRVRIREGAPLECPHIMLLMDDVKREILEPLYANRNSLKKVYDFDLNMNGGHLTGYLVTDTASVNEKLKKLMDPEILKAKYGIADNPFLFAVGDGNHSLATAKASWEKLKPALSLAEKHSHPARFALCELVNLYDDDLLFEPIHRVVFNAGEELVSKLKALRGGAEASAVYNGVKTAFKINKVSAEAIAEIQQFLDDYIEAHPGSSIDYIHGADYTLEVAKKNNGVAILMPTIKKNELFKYVMTKGVLCRKAFSMGEAEEKRYYMECKKIKV